MTPEDPEDSLRRLFRSARSEKPSDEARTRALARALASTRGRSRTRGLAFGVVVAAAAALVVTLGSRLFHAEHVSIGPEKLPPTARTNPSPELPAQPPRHEPASTTAPPHADTSTTPAHGEKSPMPRPAPTLGEELALVQAARSALDKGDAKHALALLDHYARSTPKPRLGDEATVVRLEALSRTGRGAEASELAREFVAKHPGSPLVDRARAFVAMPSASSNQPERTP